MKIKKSPLSSRRQHFPESIQEFITTASTCPLSDLAKQLQSFGTSWNQPKGDLYHWIPLLNRFDDILEEATAKSKLKLNLPTPYVFSSDEEALLVAVLDFTSLLLEHCSRRSIYASQSCLSGLLYATSLPIVIATLRVCARLAQRYSQTNSNRSPIVLISQEKLFRLVGAYPPAPPLDHSGKVTLYDLIDDTKEWSSEWAKINFQYYQVGSASELAQPEFTPATAAAPAAPMPVTPVKFDKTPEKSNDGMLTYVVSPKEVEESSLNALESRVFAQVPRDFVIDAFLLTRTAKAFTGGSKGLEMRQQLTAVRCLALEFLAYLVPDSVIQTRLFATNAQLVPSLCDLIHPDKNVPRELRTTALETLQALSLHRSKHNEILSSLSANVNYGVLLYIVRRIAKNLEDGEVIDEYFVKRLFYLLQLLSSNSHSAQVLVTAGLMSIILQIVRTPSKDYGTLKIAVTVTQHLVNTTSGAVSDFFQNGGLDIVVKRIEEEVDYHIANPDYTVEQSAILDYKISFVRAQFLRSLYKLLLSMMQSPGNADRLRNLIELSILDSLKKTISHSEILGNDIVSYAIDIMSTLIHNEPTSYAIISESKLPHVFLNAIPELIKLPKVTTIPYAIGAICLNNSGLDLVRELHALENFFQVFKSASLAQSLLHPSEIGTAFDEMVRHHPALEPEVTTLILSVVQDIVDQCGRIPGGARFFPVKADVLKTDADDELVVQDAQADCISLIENFCKFLDILIQHHSLCKEFINRGGLTPLMELYTVPSLPYDFAARPSAICLAKILKTATEYNAPVASLVILKASAKALSDIRVFLDYDAEGSFFQNLEEESVDTASKFVKSLNTVHCIAYLLSYMYMHLTVPQSKMAMPMIQPLTMVDECKSLLSDLGKLQRNCLWEDIFIFKSLSDDWRDASRVVTTEDQRSYDRRQEIIESEAKIDVTDNRYKNVKVARYMMSQMPGSVSQIFSGISRWTLSRRGQDLLNKKQGFLVGEVLAKTLLDSLKYDRLDLFQDKRDKYAYWLLLLSSSRHILFDDQRASSPSLQTVVVICFKRLGGIDVLISILEGLWYELKTLPPAEDGYKSLLSNQARTFGDAVVLQIFSTLVNSKAVIESVQTISLKCRDPDRSEYFNPSQFLVELRMAVLPVIEKLWLSDGLTNVSTPILNSFIGILTSIMLADGEIGALVKGDKAWSSDQLTADSFQGAEENVRQLLNLRLSRPLVEVALTRASAAVDRSAGPATPLPLTPEISSATNALGIFNAGENESSTDNTPENSVALASPTGPSGAVESQESRSGVQTSARRSVLDEFFGGDRAHDPFLFDFAPPSSDRGTEIDAPPTNPLVDTPMEGTESEHETEGQVSTLAAVTSDTSICYVSDLDKIRFRLRESMVSRSLIILRAHPGVVFSLANLLQSTFSGRDDTITDRRKLTADITDYMQSFNSSDGKNVATLKSTAHLLGLLLQSDLFFAAGKEALREQWELFIDLLRRATTDEESYIADVLFVIERILVNAETPLPVDTNETGPILALDEVPANIRRMIFDVLVKLPIPKTERAATAVARILVILTRDHALAVEAFDKGAIAMLVTASSQVQESGRARLQNLISLLLRHVIDYPDILRTMMKMEIRNWLSQPRPRPTDVATFVRANSSIFLRNPPIAVEVTNDICKLVLSPELSSRQPTIILKSQAASRAEDESSADKTEDGALAKEDGEDEQMTDAKLAEPLTTHKAALSELNTGVMHYLLNELHSIKEDVPVPPDVEEGKEESDSSRSEFNAANHPQFMRRIYILEIITELLSSYNQCKLEFIGYSKRSTIITPSKPRLSVLNYFLNELLISGMFTVSASSEELDVKKKHAISGMTAKLLYALVSSTGECLDANEDDSTIVHIRRFVLDAILRALKDVSTSSDVLGVRYVRLVCLSALCSKFLTGRSGAIGASKSILSLRENDAQAIAKIMFEKNFVGALTSTLADIDLNFPGAQRVVKSILKPLAKLSSVSIELSDVLSLTKPSDQADDDYISTDSGPEDYVQEERPDFLSNSALGMYEVEEDMDDEDDSEGSDMDDNVDEMEYEEEGDDDDDAHSVDEDDPYTADEEEITSYVGDPTHSYDDEDTDLSDEDDDEDDEDDEDEDDDEDGMNVREYFFELTAGFTNYLQVEIVVTGDLPYDHMHDDEVGDVVVEEGEEDEEDEDDGESSEEINDDYYNTDGDDVEEGFEGEWHNGLDGAPVNLGEMARTFREGVSPEQDGDIDGEEDDEEDDGEESDVIQPEDLDYEDLEHDLEEEDRYRDIVFRFGDMDYPHRRDMPLSYDGMPQIRHSAHIFPNSLSRPSGRGMKIWMECSKGQLLTVLGWPDMDITANPLGQPPWEEFGSSFGSSVGRSSLPVLFDDSGIPNGFIFSGRRMPSEGDLQIWNELFQNIVRSQHRRAGSHLPYPTGILPRDFESIFGYPHTRQPAFRDDPRWITESANPKSTLSRWIDESMIMFGKSGQEKASQLVNHILNVLWPIALAEDAERKKAEAEARERQVERQEEARRQQEKEAAERLAAEEAEANARREAEDAAAAAAAAAAEQSPEDEPKEANMEDAPPNEESEQGPAPPEEVQRVIVTIRGQPMDITGMGIDPEFLEALPESMREEVLTAHIREMQSTNLQNGGEQESEIAAEFLAALPPNIRDELLQQEAADRRRAEQTRETAPTEGNETDTDFATFLASLDPSLRQTILAEQSEDVLAHLPQDIVDEAHEIQRRHASAANLTAAAFLDIEPAARHHAVHLTRLPPQHTAAMRRDFFNRNGIQLLDRAGIAALTRLLYLPQAGGQRNPLYDMLVSVTANRQSRSELFNLILSVLLDGSSDIASVERSLNQISVRARPQQQVSLNTPSKSILPNTPKSPAVITKGTLSMAAEISPLQLVQQCLQALEYIVKANRQLASYFLIEHEASIGLKRAASRKGKLTKDTLSRGQKYPINILIALLDRPAIRDSAPIMDILSLLLQEITRPLHILTKTNAADKDEAGPSAASTRTEREEPHVDVTAEPGPSTGSAAELTNETEKEESRSAKLTPPVIPEASLCLLVNILTARECPNKTLHQTLATMQNLSVVPSAKEILGKELIRQAQELGRLVPDDLKVLCERIKSARAGSDIQGMALSRFSPASSDQAKLLRVLTAVDYLFDSSRENTKPEQTTSSGQEETIVKLYAGLDFGSLWSALGECLREIQERPDMLHIATVLLPLIETFMVVCKHEVLKGKTESTTAPVPGNLVRLDTAGNVTQKSMEHLFFNFTDEHKKILNQMVRNNPKLMSGSFSILVKNPKVLEFDNKRSFFSRQLHARAQTAHIHRPLAINVRRDQVFLDSYKALYFKRGDEIKYSKLNIRFHGEEGVDAGGVTREWFQVLARQMFNPDYALFIPVASDQTTFHPNRTSGVNPEHLSFFEFIGRIIGKALYEGRVLDCHFSRPVYKRILGKQVALKDMETLDLEYYKSLVWMLENDITDVITETMSLETDDYGDKKIIDLIPNGREISVTEENKREYVRLVVGYRLLTSVQDQLEHFLRGFYDIIPKDLVSIFNEQELELLICGLPDIDIDDWRNNTIYQNYSASSPQIQWFWRAVRSFDAEERAKLLQFVTGTSKVPLNGFSELEGMNGVSRFSIHRDYGPKDRLPSSHTCFNQIDLPEYDSYETLRSILLLAITEGREGFAFA
ncbi:uncharacterized protein V1518DRAFT_402950 [Limtongia smithiae]|uniref:uncharacterized protein n=1 Tax=Limtongia smithiae TaxID=1125753 RepID=UPI0034CF72DF